jgi:hypothetical protein
MGLEKNIYIEKKTFENNSIITNRIIRSRTISTATMINATIPPVGMTHIFNENKQKIESFLVRSRKKCCL